MIRTCVVLLALTATAHAAPPATAPATAPTSDERTRLVQQFAGLKRLAPRPVNQIVQFELSDGFLHVRPALRDDSGPVSIDATDWPGFLQLDTSQRTLVGRPGDFFSLSHTALTDQDRTMTITQIGVGPGYLQLSRDSESDPDDSITSNVALIQFRRGGEENPVRLNVQIGRKNASKFSTALKLVAPTFTDLLRQNPQAVREYLLPMLRDLGAASVLRLSDPAVAWQVLGDAVPVDPAMTAKIDALLAALGADDFAARAKAEEDLAALGPAGAAALRRLDLAKLGPDERSSVESAIRRNLPLTTERAAVMGRSTTFLVDSLLLDDPRLVAVASARLADLTGRPAPELPPDLPADEREKRVEAYRAALPTTAPSTQPSSD